MTNIVLDIGNSSIKTGLFRDRELLEMKRFDKSDFSGVKTYVEKLSSETSCIVSSVTNLPESFLSLFKLFGDFILFSYKTPVPVNIRYKTPQTLGVDRIAAVVGAWSLYPGQNVLVIDAGTCITYELLTDNGEYIGGSISPGLQMRFDAIHTFTDHLPLLYPKEGFSSDYGDNTEDAILSGVINGYVREVETTIRELQEKYAISRTIITGGDAFFLDRKLKNIILMANR